MSYRPTQRVSWYRQMQARYLLARGLNGSLALTVAQIELLQQIRVAHIHGKPTTTAAIARLKRLTLKHAPHAARHPQRGAPRGLHQRADQARSAGEPRSTPATTVSPQRS